MLVPGATYRLQFSPAFGFDRAAEAVAYLSALGISHLYASPVFRARSGSSHGYDIVDPARLNPELGTQEQFRDLAAAVRADGMSWLQDIVPNHMAYSPENLLLMDVLENGPHSPYYHFFDIDWEHPYESMHGRIVAPFLGSFYAESLHSGDLRLCYDSQGFGVTYYDLRLPLNIESYSRILEHNLEQLEQRLAGVPADFMRFLGSKRFFKTIIDQGESGESRRLQVQHAKTMLRSLYEESAEVRRFIDETIAAFNGTAGDPESFDLLDGLLSRQHYRLSFWKVVTEEINYRRFFTVNDLISVRVDDPAVFQHTHSLILELAAEGVFSGLRVDHVDGLYDPLQYLHRLRDSAPEAFIIVEKILGRDEQLPEGWPVQGTTGYGFLASVNGLFCRTDNAEAFTRLYRRLTGSARPYEALLHEKKQLIIGKHMAGNIDSLAQMIKKLSSRDRHGRDITLYGLRRALVEIMAHFPVYRTYMSSTTCNDVDMGYIREAIQKAIATSPGLTYELHFIEKFLLYACTADAESPEHEQWLHFAMCFQQFTGPVMAKAVEDTVFYIYNRLISLNEVGGSPEIFGMPLEAFHAFSAERCQRWPHDLSATATHDTKRGEDGRARINVLSELPAEWEKCVKTWARLNRPFKTKSPTRSMPDANDEYLLYQSLLGAWTGSHDQAFMKRVQQYLLKAVREAKVHTAWIRTDEDYENACLHFVERILTPSDRNRFLDAFAPFQQKIAWYGMLNSLAQVLIKIAAPGIPDFYQGAEFWDFSLVDPDNRRPVDFVQRAEALADIESRAGNDMAGLIAGLQDSWPDGRIKQFLVWRLLRARAAQPELFEQGSYEPVRAEGPRAQSIIAFARRSSAGTALAVAPRFLTGWLPEGELPLGEKPWADTMLIIPGSAPAAWHDEVTGHDMAGGGRLAVGHVLSTFPAALLISANEQECSPLETMTQ